MENLTFENIFYSEFLTEREREREEEEEEEDVCLKTSIESDASHDFGVGR